MNITHSLLGQVLPLRARTRGHPSEWNRSRCSHHNNSSSKTAISQSVVYYGFSVLCTSEHKTARTNGPRRGVSARSIDRSGHRRSCGVTAGRSPLATQLTQADGTDKQTATRESKSAAVAAVQGNNERPSEAECKVTAAAAASTQPTQRTGSCRRRR